MRSISIETDQILNKQYLKIDLDEVASMTNNELNDIADIIIAMSRKTDEKITLTELGNQLKNEGLIYPPTPMPS
jgi:hypothetical protein